jgi:hypothetical protein
MTTKWHGYEYDYQYHQALGERLFHMLYFLNIIKTISLKDLRDLRVAHENCNKTNGDARAPE